MKTVFIRNTYGGMIWQVYHVQNSKEYDMLKRNSSANGFHQCELVEHDPDYGETFPNWRTEANLPLTGEVWS